MSSFEGGPKSEERKKSGGEQGLESFLAEVSQFSDSVVRMNGTLQQALQEAAAAGMPITEEMEADRREMQETIDGLTGEKGAQERERLRTYISSLPSEERESCMELVRAATRRMQESLQQQLDEMKAGKF